MAPPSSWRRCCVGLALFALAAVAPAVAHAHSGGGGDDDAATGTRGGPLVLVDLQAGTQTVVPPTRPPTFVLKEFAGSVFPSSQPLNNLTAGTPVAFSTSLRPLDGGAGVGSLAFDGAVVRSYAPAGGLPQRTLIAGVLTYTFTSPVVVTTTVGKRGKTKKNTTFGPGLLTTRALFLEFGDSSTLATQVVQGGAGRNLAGDGVLLFSADGFTVSFWL